MVEVETLKKHLQALEEYVNELESYRALTYRDFCSTSQNYWAVQHGLQLAIQSLLDIGSHVLAAETTQRPEEYRDIIVGLGEAGVLPAAFAARILGMAGFRNILVHRYLQVDLWEVYQHLQKDLDDFRQFSRYILTWLEKRGLLSREESEPSLGGPD